MDYAKALEIAKRVTATGEKNITDQEYTFAKKVYKEINGKPFRGCSNCWTDLVILTTLKLKQISTNQNQQPIMGKFKLKPGKMICLHGFEPITEKNLTDEKALGVLKKSNAHIKNFIAFPDDWEKQVEKFKPTVVKPQADAPKTGADKEKENTDTTGGDENEAAAELGRKKERLEGMSKKELKEICETKELPAEEWEKFNKEKLVEYILGKV